MTIDIKAIDAFDRWWNTRPEPHISSPRQSHMKMQQDRMLAIWVSAWDAATNQVNLTDEEIDQAWRTVDHTVEYGKYRIDVARAILRKAQEK